LWLCVGEAMKYTLHMCEMISKNVLVRQAASPLILTLDISERGAIVLFPPTNRIDYTHLAEVRALQQEVFHEQDYYYGRHNRSRAYSDHEPVSASYTG
jgi:hypothetical protein